MQIVLLWIHLVCLAMGGAATFGMPVIGAMMGSAPGEARASLFAAGKRISTISRGALVGLIVTGVILVVIGPGFGGVGAWFWVKMALVVALIAGIVQASRAWRAAYAGDAAAAGRARTLGLVNIGLLLGIVLAAILAFG